MQITFTDTSGKEITVADLRAGRDGSVALPPEHRPTVWQAATMVAVPAERRPTSWIAGAWITSTMKV